MEYEKIMYICKLETYPPLVAECFIIKEISRL